MDDPYDFFTNPALRSRLSRFQNPSGGWNSMFGQRKRRTSPTMGVHEKAADLNAAYDPHESFFSHFDPHWNESAWPPTHHQTLNGTRKRVPTQPQAKTHIDRNNNSDMFNYIPPEFRQYMPDEFGFPHHQTRQTAPVNSPQQQYKQRNNSGDLQRPKFCDAAMQTDEDLSGESQSPGVQQMNVESSTADSGAEQQRGQRSHGSPFEKQEQPRMNRSTAEAYTSPNNSFSSAQAHGESENRKGRSNSNTMGNVRRVPIIIEGGPSSFPKDSPLKQQHQQHQQQAPTPPPHPQQTTQPQDNRPVEPPSPSIESINKIQGIQQDVLDLMFKVEQFQGNSRTDKDYKYLDEMLTRNLLKLDTIDTRGNDSIRLARKEAIKCVQASLNVLEAKADGRTPGANAEEKTQEEAPEESQEVVQKPTEQSENDASNPAEAQELDRSKIPIPLPPIPSHEPDPKVPEPTIRDCVSDEESNAKPVKHVTKKKITLQTPV